MSESHVGLQSVLNPQQCSVLPIIASTKGSWVADARKSLTKEPISDQGGRTSNHPPPVCLLFKLQIPRRNSYQPSLRQVSVNTRESAVVRGQRT